MPYFVLGLGANILVGDRGFRGLVIRNAARAVRFDATGRLWVESGVVMATSSPRRFAAAGRDWSTMPASRARWAAPSGRTFTSSPRRPSGSARCSSRRCSSLRVARLNGQRRSWIVRHMQFGYDTSVLHEGRDVALAVTFKLAARRCRRRCIG